MKLSQAGKTHPVTQLLDREVENVRIWQEMPSLDGINLMEPRDSGLVLLEGRDGSPSPVLAVGQFGKDGPSSWPRMRPGGGTWNGCPGEEPVGLSSLC